MEENIVVGIFSVGALVVFGSEYQFSQDTVGGSSQRRQGTKMAPYLSQIKHNSIIRGHCFLGVSQREKHY